MLFLDGSPQTRGRGERINQTFQGQLVSEPRLHTITTAEAATQYLNEIFIPKFSKRFGVKPGDTTPAWRHTIAKLSNILCTRYQRKVNNDKGADHPASPYKDTEAFCEGIGYCQPLD